MRAAHQERAATLKTRLREANLPVLSTDTHIVPLMVGDPVLCKAASDRLLQTHHIYIQPINYPTVPRGTERLRIKPTPLHTDAMIDELVTAVTGFGAHWAFPASIPCRRRRPSPNRVHPVSGVAHPSVAFGKTGILLVNLGTPTALTRGLRPYLKQFCQTGV